MLVNQYLDQAIAFAAKTNYTDNLKLEGVGFVNNSFYTTFKSIAITKDEQGVWKLELPQVPVGIGASEGVSTLVLRDDKNKQCWLLPNTILYDRPTIKWCNNEMKQSSFILVGNGSNDDSEINYIKNTFQCNADVWLFWPRNPILLEKMLICNPYLSYNERNCEAIFIGNYENQVQSKFRETSTDWNSVIEEFHNTKGSNHKFTPEEYLNKIRKSKFGLCLRGFGSKCHREVELMAFGTVPLITDEVSINSYIEPPIENKHYIHVKNPEDLKQKIENITESQWEIMSKSCSSWYMKNIHSDNFFRKTINHIIYS